MIFHKARPGTSVLICTDDDGERIEILDGDYVLSGIPDAKECRALLAEMKAAQYWPNVWHVNERGNADLLRITTRGARIVASYV